MCKHPRIIRLVQLLLPGFCRLMSRQNKCVMLECSFSASLPPRLLWKMFRTGLTGWLRESTSPAETLIFFFFSRKKRNLSRENCLFYIIVSSCIITFGEYCGIHLLSCFSQSWRFFVCPAAADCLLISLSTIEFLVKLIFPLIWRSDWLWVCCAGVVQQQQKPD